jgi:NADPH:quinone reductase-like Zn-dependent oxidoreductase
MLAALYERTGPAREVLQVADLPDPQPGAGEVRVRVRASGVNPSDGRMRAGLTIPMAFAQQIPGQDGAGRIDAVGEGVDPRLVGQPVWIYHAALGRPNGTAAQYTVVPAQRAVPMPAEIDWAQAAGLGIPYMTAHRCLFGDGPISGQDVLIAGGAGAVGNAAIQLAKWGKARVIATVSNPAKAELAHRAGADHVIVDYRRADAAADVRRAAPDGVTRIVEVAPHTNLGLDLDVIAPGGTIMTYAMEQQDPALPVGRLMVNNIRLAFMLIYTTPLDAHLRAIEDISAALAEGALRPLPTVRFPLTDIAAAHEAVERHAVGKVIVEIP